MSAQRRAEQRERIARLRACTYEVKSLHTPSGLPVWTVVATEDGVAKGGDHHWLNEATAHNAAVAYRNGTACHGDSETTVLRKMGATR